MGVEQFGSHTRITILRDVKMISVVSPPTGSSKSVDGGIPFEGKGSTRASKATLPSVAAKHIFGKRCDYSRSISVYER